MVTTVILIKNHYLMCPRMYCSFNYVLSQYHKCLLITLIKGAIVIGKIVNNNNSNIKKILKKRFFRK